MKWKCLFSHFFRHLIFTQNMSHGTFPFLRQESAYVNNNYSKIKYIYIPSEAYMYLLQSDIASIGQ